MSADKDLFNPVITLDDLDLYTNADPVRMYGLTDKGELTNLRLTPAEIVMALLRLESRVQELETALKVNG
ncbi:hypothetical protein KE423_003907 [Salmonella enterica]|nr:hypothetical protein [Salmonella enterica]